MLISSSVLVSNKDNYNDVFQEKRLHSQLELRI